MHMITRMTLMIIIAFFMFSSLSDAEEGKSIVVQTPTSTQEKVLPFAIQKFKDNTEESVAIKNITEVFNRNVSRVRYSEGGFIDRISFEDGTEVKYSYKYDENGNLSSVEMSSDDLKLLFKAEEDSKNKSDTPPDLPKDSLDINGDGVVDEYDKEPANNPADNQNGDEQVDTNSDGINTDKQLHTANTNPKVYEPITGSFEDDPESNKTDFRDPEKSPKPVDKPAITIYVPQDALPQIAHSSIDFDKIKDGFEKALKEKNEAYEEYMKKTAPYYGKILNELAASADGLKAEGVKVDLGAKNKNPDGSMDAGERKNVDEVVQEIRRRAKEGRGEARQAGRFIAVERILADEFLSPNRQIFEDKIKQAVGYVNKVIDEVIKSKLAVYLNARKDKIEAIVNLPEAKK